MKAAVFVTAFALLSSSGFATDASAGVCGDDMVADTPPRSRPYRLGADKHPPEVRKHLAMTTINTRGVPARCDCTASRDWDWGLDARAVASAKAAMDAKEALAIHNYAKFGVPAEQVPVEARTIWFRTTWRNGAEQVCLRTRLGLWAAVPGTSKHEWGMAVDLEDWGPHNAGVDIGFMRANGWCPTVRSEPWHLEYRPLLVKIGEAGRCIK